MPANAASGSASKPGSKIKSSVSLTNLKPPPPIRTASKSNNMSGNGNTTANTQVAFTATCNERPLTRGHLNQSRIFFFIDMDKYEFWPGNKSTSIFAYYFIEKSSILSHNVGVNIANLIILVALIGWIIIFLIRNLCFSFLKEEKHMKRKFL